MDISLRKRISARHRAVLAGLGVLGCCVLANLVLTDVSSAAVPTGLDCQYKDGKISGRGSTYQTVLQDDLIAAYNNDFCGVTPEQFTGDPAGNTMIAYNYAAAEAAGATGSGAGLKAASCRTDPFTGTDKPYTNKELTEIDGAPGAYGGSACKLAFEPPFTPHAAKNEFPNSEDIEAPLMSFPIGGSSVAIVINFGTACTKDPTELKLNPKEASRLFGGAIATWADSELAENNKVLGEDGCTGAVTRVVRQDSSGTTSIFKQYLIRAENARTGQACASGKLWEAYFSTNTEWPGKQAKSAGEEGTCSAIENPAKSGNPEEISLVKAKNGSVGYADLPQAVTEGKGLAIATVENATKTGYQSPSNGKAANCTYSSVSLPGGTASEAVGLGSETWASDQAPTNHQNVTDRGAKYPICGLTWDLVFSGLSNTKESAIGPLTADQRRTLYSYFTFLLSSTAQNTLGSIDYAPLPPAWLQSLREGFQENF